MFYRGLLALTFVFVSTMAWAHGTGQHVLGTVTAIDAKHVEVKTPKGTVVDVQLNKQTRYKAKGKPRSAVPPTVGDRVVIEATKEDKGLLATEVHYASGASQSQATPVPAPVPVPSQ